MSVLEIVLYCAFGALALIMMINTILKIVKIRKMRKKGLTQQQIEEKDDDE